MGIEVRPRGALDAWLRAIGEAHVNAKDLRGRPWSRIGLVFSEEVRRVFVAQGIPRWAPLKTATLKRRLREGYSTRPILGRTGRLGASLMSPRHPDAIEEKRRDTYRRGTKAPGAAAHQLGTRHMIARRMLPNMTRVAEEGAKLVAEHVRNPFDKLRRR